mmetsp:Transcript_4205/g.12331  ORF Transcript_4205/g.12331 Transcript_4205/m.12331 type:complete len:146 (-) Transcript_4205:2127-2564(-)
MDSAMLDTESRRAGPRRGEFGAMEESSWSRLARKVRIEPALEAGATAAPTSGVKVRAASERPGEPRSLWGDEQPPGEPALRKRKRPPCLLPGEALQPPGEPAPKSLDLEGEEWPDLGEPRRLSSRLTGTCGSSGRRCCFCCRQAK